MVIEYCLLSVESKNDSSGDNKKNVDSFAYLILRSSTTYHSNTEYNPR